MNASTSPDIGPLLRAFSDRSQARNIDHALEDTLRALQAGGHDRLPLPGQGQTLQRWRALAQVAGCDLALAKLYEGHTDALAILAECDAAALGAEGLWGVWAAEPPAARVRITAQEGRTVRLQGLKAWCSGALQIDRALITAWREDGRGQLVAIELGHSRQRVIDTDWQAVGMASTASITLAFDDCPGIAVGEPDQYLARPGFWQGGGGIAACWYGAAQALADYLHRHCGTPRDDPHADAHLGSVDAALIGARAALRECAAWIDQHPQADASFAVRRARAQVEHAAEHVLRQVGRALGATPFCRTGHFARLSADLPVYLRQSHAERDLAALGQQRARSPAGDWQL